MHAGTGGDMENPMSDTTAAVITVAKNAPPIFSGLWSLFGHPLSENVAALTIVWFLLLIVEKLCRWGYAAWTRRK